MSTLYNNVVMPFENDNNTNEGDTSADNNTHYPTCKFCGSTTILPQQYADPDEADKQATYWCSCKGAIKYREEQQKAKRRENNITKLKASIEDIKEYCLEHEISFLDDFANIIITNSTYVIDDIIKTASLTFYCFSIKIKQGNKSALIIKVSYGDSVQYEV